MMSCEEFAERASDYLEGRVPFGRKIGMWFHAVMCDRCSEYLDQLEQVIELMHETGDRERREGAPEEIKGEMVEEFRAKYGS